LSLQSILYFSLQLSLFCHIFCAVNDDCSYLYICTGQSEFTGDEIFQNGLLSACNTVRSRCIPFMDAAIRPFYWTHQQFPRFIRCQRSNWLFDAAWAKPSLILMKLWSAGGAMLLYLSAMQGISKTMYEAAVMEGASRVQMFFKVTLPMI